jgi:hypothetical protein
MRIITVLTIFLLGCTTNKYEGTDVDAFISRRCKSENLCSLPFSFVIANPEIVNTKRIGILGYLRRFNNGWYLFQSEENAIHSNFPASLRLVFDESESKFQSVPLFKNSWVGVTGVFQNEADEKSLAWGKIEITLIQQASIWREEPPPPPPPRPQSELKQN